MTVFTDLNQAIKEGWMVYRPFVGGGCLLRQSTPSGFIMAVCESRTQSPPHAWEEEA